MSDDEKNPPKPSLHPVYTVHNIQHKIRVLDGTKVTYASWVKLFKLHARGYKVLHHIDGMAPPAKTDPGYDEWCEIDSHVLQWIYGTLSDDLLARVLDADSTAYAAWTRVQNIFLNNKGARAASLEHEFTNLKLASMSSLDEYCQRLRDLASQHNDVDATVTDQRLVLQLVLGLPSSYDTVASYINQTLRRLETARSMLELEQHRHNSQDDSRTALVAPSSLPSHSSPSWPEPTATALLPTTDPTLSPAAIMAAVAPLTAVVLAATLTARTPPPLMVARTLRLPGSRSGHHHRAPIQPYRIVPVLGLHSRRGPLLSPVSFAPPLLPLAAVATPPLPPPATVAVVMRIQPVRTRTNPPIWVVRFTPCSSIPPTTALG
ncbi:hypothetical protein vseg_018269 [Gypsophila vaccaria]